jgi:putative ABC transport system ATP-binding protein
VLLLAIDAVAKAHWRGDRQLRVLGGVSLELDAGEFVAVYGPRSSGKTTLLRLAAGLDRPDAGRVAFAGRDVAELTGRELARLLREEIGWVERSGPRGDALPVADYVALPLLGRERRTGARRAAMAALERLGVGGCADERWAGLSDAERTLVALAHALVRRPRLLVVDDPTGGLDVADREHILGLLRELAADEGAGVLMAVPEIPSTLRAHRVLSLSGGRLIGPPAPSATVVDFARAQRRG